MSPRPPCWGHLFYKTHLSCPPPSGHLLLFAKLQMKLSPWSKAEITREAAVIVSIIFMDSIYSKRLQNDIKKIYT